MNVDKNIINWLLQGDISIQFQTYRDLIGKFCNDLQMRIESEGWGKQFLQKRNKNGHWGLRFYQPKWISTHYTLLDLKNLAINPGCSAITETINMVLKETKAADGGILPVGEMKKSDVCINGMVLNYSSYFGADEEDLKSIVDNILSQQLPDGGFNCMLNRSGAVHSSLHTTISVLEGIWEYKNNNYTYRLDELLKAKSESEEFILQHHLYKSDKTGQIIDKRFLNLTYPCRWRYDILRALDYFQYAKVPYDSRMQDAIDVILNKRKKDGTWNVQAHHSEAVHFHMETAGKPSRWNTLRVLRVLKHFCVKI
ncbi:MAG TPA: hypothetical protein P5132_07260 [Bacteroidales bacterium]|nr:hypothetical protein [Bacteroidales bacterium]